MTRACIPTIFCSIIFLHNISFLLNKVSAVDVVQISNDLLNEEYMDNQEVLVVQSYNDTFVCLATNTGDMVSMRWEMHDGDTGIFIAHNDEFPHMLPNSDNPDMTDTLGQVTITPTFDMTANKLRCRVEDNVNIDQQIVLDVQVAPSSSSIKLFDASKPEGYSPNEKIRVTENVRHSLTCVIQATLPECQVTWTTVSDNIRTTNAQNSEDTRLVDTTSVSTFVPERLHHGQMVECSAVIIVPGIGSLPSPPASIQVELEVYGPPDTPVITGSPDITENESIELECIANDAYPRGTLKWSLNSNDITDSSEQTDVLNNNGRYNMMSTLTYPMSRAQNQQRMRCDAQHDTRVSPLRSSEVTINVKFCPTEVTLSMTASQCPMFVLANGDNTVNLSCRSSSSNPKSTITWYINGDPQEPGHTPRYANSDNNGQTTQLDFTSRPLMADDVGIAIKCCANIATEDICQTQTCSQVCNPDIYFSPTFEDITVPPESKSEGDSVTLSCVVNARPQPENFVQWTRDGNTIGGVFDNDAGRLLLHIDSVEKDDAGLYMCTANNGFGTAKTNELPLKVVYKPVLIQRNHIGVVQKGSRVSLDVTIQSNPQAKISWSSPTGPVPVNGNDEYEVGVNIQQDDVRGAVIDSYLVIKTASSTTDVGNFVCRASNSKGSVDVTFDIEVAAIPSAPSSPKFVSSTSDSLTFEWMSDIEDGPQWFWVACGDMDATNIGQNTKYTVTGLKSNTLYLCEVYGENDAGIGPSRIVEDVTNPSPPDELGIDVKHDRSTNEVYISGVLAAGSDICVQLEVTIYNDVDEWNKTGPCHVNDTTQSVDMESNVRARVCSVVPPGKCSGPYAALQVGNDSTQIIIIACCVCGAVLIVVIILVVVLRRKRLICQGPNPPKPPARPTVMGHSHDNDSNNDRSADNRRNVVSYVNPGVDNKYDRGSYVEPIQGTNEAPNLHQIRLDGDGYVCPNYHHQSRPNIDVDAVVYDNPHASTAAVRRPPKETTRLYDKVAPDPEEQNSNDQPLTNTSISSTPDVIPNKPNKKVALKPPPKRTAKPTTAKPTIPDKPAVRPPSTLTPVRAAPTLPPGTKFNTREKVPLQPRGDTMGIELAKALERRNKHEQV